MRAMSEATIIQKCEALIEVSGLSESYVAKLVFNDGKGLDRLRNGGEMLTSTRIKAASRIRDLQRKYRVSKRKR